MHLNAAGLPYVKLAALCLVWLGTGGFVYASSVDPRGFLRRSGGDYVASLDELFQSMMLPKRGSEIAWLQVVIFVGAIAAHAMTDDDRYLMVSAAVGFLPRALLRMMVRRRSAKIDAQAPAFALALSNTLRTTANVGDAMRFTVEVSAKPLRDEIDLALREIHVGSTVEEALLAAGGRANAPALDVVISTVLVGQKTGGDLPRILEGTASSLRELKRLEEYTRKVTRNPKQALVLSIVMMVMMVAYMPRIIPHFFDPLLTTAKGQVILLYCALAFVGALVMAWRIVSKSI